MVWIQYSILTGEQCATLNRAVDELPEGIAQIEYDGDPTGVNFDITQNPPLPIPYTPPSFIAPGDD